ncbi:MAG: hypothetical protein JXQ23_13010 [Clostridia bacterium]|nr:hypothetical protein [Clostridia bacterium]
MNREYNSIDFSSVKENETAARLYMILQKWIPFVDKQFNVWGKRPNCGHFFGGSYFYSGETAFSMFVYSILATFGDFNQEITGVSRDEMKLKAVKALRYLCFTHDVGPEDCVREKSDNVYANGTKWGGKNDEFFRASAMGRTCTLMSICALMLFDSLDQETLSYVEKIVETYADRWSNEIPRAGTYFDTQSEENAWTAIGISSGLILFKTHPRREKWLDGFNKWCINSVSTYKDRMNTGSYQGKSLRNYWMKGVTFHPDFTNENHSFVHPSYVAAGTVLRGESAVFLKMISDQIPDCVYWNNQNVYHKAVKTWFGEDGLMVPIQGQDWWYTQYHGRQFYHGLMSVFHNEEYSTHFENICIGYIEKMQDSHKNGCLLEDKHDQKVDEYGHYSLKHMEHGCVLGIAYSFLLHTFFGENKTELSSEQIFTELKGVYEFPFGCIVVNRTKDIFTSFSWRNKVMAVTLPKEGMWTITPVVGSMTGEIVFESCDIPQSISNQSEIRDCEKRDINILKEGFGATCQIIRGDRQIIQYVSFTSLPNGITVYSELFDVEKDCSTTIFHTGLIGVRNENIKLLKEQAKGYRKLYTSEKTYHFNGYFGGEKDDIEYIEHNGYVNVDDRIGYLLFGGNNVKYINKHCYKSWRGVEDILVLNNNEQVIFKKGDRINSFSMIALPNMDHEKTAALNKETIKYTCNNINVQLFELNDYLVYSNFNNDQYLLKASSQTKNIVNLYEGETFIENNALTRVLTLPSFKSSYLKSSCQICFENDIRDLHILIMNGRITILNRHDLPVRVTINKCIMSVKGYETVTLSLEELNG